MYSTVRTIDRLLDKILLLIHEIQELPPPLNKSAKFDFVFGLNNLRRRFHDFARSRHGCDHGTGARHLTKLLTKLETLDRA